MQEVEPGAALLQQYAAGEILIDSLPNLLRMSLEDINSRRAYLGHWGTGLFSLLDRPIATVTVLRDPFERVVSGVRFAHRMQLPEEHPAIREVFARGNWEEIVSHPEASRSLEGMQTLYLGASLDLRKHLATPPPGVEKSPEELSYLEAHWTAEILAGLINMDAVVAEAKRRLDTMEVVGIFEQLPETVERICGCLGFPVPSTLPRERMSPERAAASHRSYRHSGDISPEVIRRIDELTARDREVYEYAQRIFARQQTRQRRSIWPMNLAAIVRRSGKP
jgi:hypothetical protein